MEEEGARRRAYKGRGGAGRAGFLAGLNEDDEDVSDEETSRSQGQQIQPPHRELHEGRAGQRDAPRRHANKPFDLTIDGATLLSRRQRDAQGRIPIDLSPLANAIEADTIDAARSPMQY
jgi:hypothetical protein